MKTFKIRFSATRNFTRRVPTYGISRVITVTISAPTFEMAWAMVKAEWKDEHEGRWLLDVISSQEVIVIDCNPLYPYKIKLSSMYGRFGGEIHE